MRWFYCSRGTVGSAGEGRGAAFSGRGLVTWQSETCPFASGGRCKGLAWCLDQPQMVRRGFVLKLESIWGWQIGRLDLLTFLLFCPPEGYFPLIIRICIYLFFLSIVIMSLCPGSTDEVRFNDLLVVPWMATHLQSCPRTAA